MIDLVVAVAAAGLFALWLNRQYAVLLRDGILAALVLFLIYMALAANR
ncbi:MULTISPECIES: hypothetical protein [unclassified Streptomyces]|nr:MULTISPECIES: hypothetical protein [unclassified Streptomyces]